MKITLTSFSSWILETQGDLETDMKHSKLMLQIVHIFWMFSHLNEHLVLKEKKGPCSETPQIF